MPLGVCGEPVPTEGRPRRQLASEAQGPAVLAPPQLWLPWAAHAPAE